MRVLIGCERSGVVASAFTQAGCDAVSCDLEHSSGAGSHIMGDVFSAIYHDWDMIILHPPCTHLAVCGNKHYAGTQERSDAIEWTVDLFNHACNHAGMVALENPVGVLSSKWRKPDQYIQPWQYGHGETKKTGLWLHNLPRLKSTNVVDGREQRVWRMSPSKDRSRLRSETYKGIALAMAEQWA